MDLRPDPVLERLVRQAGTRLDAVGPGGAPAAALAALRDINAFALAAPVEADGFDLGLGYAAMICAELGRRALPEVYGGVLLVLDALAPRDPARAADLANGETPVSAAGVSAAGVDAAPGRSRDAARLETTATGFELHGVAVFDDAGSADSGAALCCVPAVLPSDDPGRDSSLRFVLLTAPQWRAHTTAAPGGGLRLDAGAIAVTEADVLGGESEQHGADSPGTDPVVLLARALVRQAGYLIGLGEGALALAVRHAARRRQFGRAVLDNQGISLPLAQSRVALAAGRLMVRQAAWLADAGEPFALEAVQSLAAASETALAVVRQAIQVHGARGLNLEYPVHAFYQPVRTAATRYGSASALWREAGALRLAAAARIPVPAASAAAVLSQERPSR